MFGLIEWVLDKIAPIALTSEPGADGDDYWQIPIVSTLTDEHSHHAQEMDRRISGEERLDG